MSRRLFPVLILALGMLVLHEGAMAVTGHDTPFVPAGDEPGHHHDGGATGHDDDGLLPTPCDVVRDIAPSLQRPGPDPQPVVAPSGAIRLVRVDPDEAWAKPGTEATLAVRCRAVFQVYRI